MSEDKELSGLISLRASGGFHDSQAALEAFEEYCEKVVNEQVEACVSAITKELELHTPNDRMRHIVDICRDASLTKRGK